MTQYTGTVIAVQAPFNTKTGKSKTTATIDVPGVGHKDFDFWDCGSPQVGSLITFLGKANKNPQYSDNANEFNVIDGGQGAAAPMAQPSAPAGTVHAVMPLAAPVAQAAVPQAAPVAAVAKAAPSGDPRQDSIQRQCALKAAVEYVGSVGDNATIFNVVEYAREFNNFLVNG